MHESASHGILPPGVSSRAPKATTNQPRRDSHASGNRERSRQPRQSGPGSPRRACGHWRGSGRSRRFGGAHRGRRAAGRRHRDLLEPALRGDEGQREAPALSPPPEGAGRRRAAASGPHPRAWLLDVHHADIRPDGSGRGRIFDVQRLRQIRLRRLGHRLRRLWPFERYPWLVRHQERRCRPRGHGADRRARDRASAAATT